MEGETWKVSKENSVKLQAIKQKFVEDGIWENALLEKRNKKWHYQFTTSIFEQIEKLAELRHISTFQPVKDDIVGVMAEFFAALIFRKYYSLDEFFTQFELGLRQDNKTARRLGDAGSDLKIEADGEVRLIQVKGSDTTYGTKFTVNWSGLKSATDWCFIKVNPMTRKCEFYMAVKSAHLIRHITSLTEDNDSIWADIEALPESKIRDPWEQRFGITYKSSRDINTPIKRRRKRPKTKKPANPQIIRIRSFF